MRERAPLTWRLGELLRKMWNPRSFKGHVSPHEFAQEVITQSKKRFGLDAADPVEFLQWLLNFMHRELCAVDGAKSTIVSRCFRGELKVETLDEAGAVTNTQAVPFLMLGLDLPPQPLFQDALERNILPQVSLGSLLHKYNGVEVTEDPRQGRRRFSLRRLPPYLILHMKRFFKNNFFLEKNHTLVTFPMRALDVAEAVTPAVLRESANGQPPSVVATGPAAINQAMKAIAIARTYLRQSDASGSSTHPDIAVYPEFVKLDSAQGGGGGANDTLSAMQLVLSKRSRRRRCGSRERPRSCR